MPNENQEWVSLSQAAKIFSVSPQVMRSMLSEAGTPVLQLPKRIRIKKSDLELLFSQHFAPLGK